MATASEEEELDQIVQYFMESCAKLPPVLPAIPLHQQQTFLLLEVTSASLLAQLPPRKLIDRVFWFQGILRDCTGTEVEVFDRALKHVGAHASDHEGNRGRLKKRLMMRLRMDSYDTSLCRSSWVSTIEWARGEYKYIDVMMANKGGTPTRILVDIDFQSQFELLRPTIAYAYLAGILPPVFVGREKKLNNVVLR